MCPLEKRRLVLGLSRADLGSKIKTTGEAVRLWERGDRTPSAEFYPVIAKALKVPVAEVIGWFHKETSTLEGPLHAPDTGRVGTMNPDTEFHPAASIFPLMTEDEFEALKSDIRDNGLHHAIVRHEGKILDGRNRYRACTELGITPKIIEWNGEGSPAEFVWGENFHRRHLSSGQKAACAISYEAELKVEAKKRQKAGASEGGKKSGESRQGFDTKVPAIVPEPSKPKNRDGESREKAARVVGISPRYVQDAKLVNEKKPELLEKVKAGTMTLPQATREVRRDEKREALKAKADASPILPVDQSWDLITGDCIDELAKMKAGSARLIFADPPYNIGIDYGGGKKADLLADEEFILWCGKWINQCVRILTDGGSLWLLINDEYADYIGLELRKAGLHRRHWLKWYESFGVNVSQGFNRCSRHLFYCVKDPKKFVFNADAVNRPSDRQIKYGDKRADTNGKTWDDVWGINPPLPRLVDNARDRIPDFPTQLPIGLLEAIVGCASDPTDLVLDPFNGSGTTGVACIRLGRRYAGIEKSRKFAELAKLRLKAAEAELSERRAAS